ncbi:hypothetical protein [Nostoc commune]|uniref:hypothetical protein n=1 Tax=Nostoc commune TaxID=1178 RepID=UPI0018C58F9C|nr:hypothetical protein [Nostoc commune]MBG1258073.1 hypothetical protein [Nostoc commune BAE]
MVAVSSGAGCRHRCQLTHGDRHRRTGGVCNLTFQDTEVPTPKANECLIRVKAFSMNRGKLKRSQNNPLGIFAMQLARMMGASQRRCPNSSASARSICGRLRRG